MKHFFIVFTLILGMSNNKKGHQLSFNLLEARAGCTAYSWTVIKGPWRQASEFLRKSEENSKWGHELTGLHNQTIYAKNYFISDFDNEFVFTNFRVPRILWLI